MKKHTMVLSLMLSFQVHGKLERGAYAIRLYKLCYLRMYAYRMLFMHCHVNRLMADVLYISTYDDTSLG